MRSVRGWKRVLVLAGVSLEATALPDGRHLNERGETQKAEAMFEYLTRVFTSRPALLSRSVSG